jgi:hypothetical protein
MAFLRHAAEVRVDAAATRRARLRNLVDQAAAEGTFAGVLADLAEQRTGVVVVLDSGREHRGRIVGLGDDFVAIEDGAAEDSAPTFVAVRAITFVRALRARQGGGASRVVTGRTLADVLTEMAAEHAMVRLMTAQGEVVGQLRAVGRDVATVRLSGRGEHVEAGVGRSSAARAAHTYVAVRAVTEVRQR